MAATLTSVFSVSDHVPFESERTWKLSELPDSHMHFNNFDNILNQAVRSLDNNKKEDTEEMRKQNIAEATYDGRHNQFSKFS